jgi:hypothetical protein
MCGGLQNSVDFGETEPSMCSEGRLTVTVGGSEVSDVGAEEVLGTQVDISSTLLLSTVPPADKVCNIVLLRLVQRCSVASAF